MDKTLSSRRNTGSRISGHVFSHKGMMLNGALLTCDGTETSTLADGSYTFNDLLPGTYEMTVCLQGFQSLHKNICVSEDEESIQDFYLSEALGNAKIYGRVIDDDTGKPVNQGTVILILPVTNKYSHIKSNGNYEFNYLSAGVYTLSTSIPGYEDAVTVLRLEENETKMYEFICNTLEIEEPPWG